MDFLTCYSYSYYRSMVQRKYFRLKTEKSELLNCILNLGIKFQLKLTTLICWTRFAQKGYFQLKMEKLNTIIEFCIFELV